MPISPGTWFELPGRGPCRRCGCSYEVHTHLRDGSDCGACGRRGPEGCMAYQPPREQLLAPLWRFMRRR